MSESTFGTSSQTIFVTHGDSSEVNHIVLWNRMNELEERLRKLENEINNQ